MPDHRTGTREKWQEAREELLELEKEHTRRGDELTRMRRELPCVKVGKDYRLDTDEGPRRREGRRAARPRAWGRQLGHGEPAAPAIRTDRG